ncbi:MAG: WecB/TagA/CpsF family glycosyltransferase [Rhodobacteraceae bacterium]|nr:WecB/TagA/CpsF family glycosyltransferase [Paracoccaceae bacterium]
MGGDLSKRVHHIFVGGMPVADVSERDLLEAMASDIERLRLGELPQAVSVMDSNGQALSLYASDPNFRKAIDSADIIHADGQFIVWASRLGAAEPVSERTATTDFIHAAAAKAASSEFSFYLLGSTERVNARAVDKLRDSYPGLRIAGRRNGYFDEAEVDGIIEDINASGADVVWVGLGKPREQFFVETYKHRIDTAWIVTCGGCFNFLAGDYVRAPVWMQRWGLEWLHRMATGPGHLIGRYLYTIPHAIGLVIWNDILRIGRTTRENRPT